MKKQNLFFLLSLVLILAFTDSFAQENRILRVNLNSTAADPDGTTWTLAYQHLQDALDEARSDNDVTEIWVAGGTYYPDLGAGVSNDVRTESFTMRSDLKLLGGYFGDDNYPEFRDIDTYETILSGDIGSLNISTDNTFNIITCNYVTGVVFDGITISDGYADGSTTDRGSGIYAVNSNFTLSNCKIINNKATSYGGAICIWSGYMEIVDCVFEGNHSLGQSGGAIFLNKTASGNIEGNVFRSNVSKYMGGAICSLSHVLYSLTPVTISNCEFRLNRCGDFSNNQATGGAIHFSGGNSGEKIENCKFFNNETYGNGGAVSISGKATIVNSIFAFNESLNVGGGVYIYSNSDYNLGDGKILNSTFYENTASDGEGIAVINKIHEDEKFVSITNCILWDEGLNDEISYENLEDIKVTFSDIKNNSLSGLGNIVSIPLFVNPSQYNFQLYGSSDCLNTGYNEADGLPLYDINGNNRINCSFVDMGAYEAQGKCDRIYVNDDVSGGANNGTSWSDAYVSLQDALDEADPGTEIWVADGIYKPSEGGSTPESYTFDISNGVLLYGGFQGIDSETSLDDRDYENNLTILSGNILDINDDSDNCHYVVTVNQGQGQIDGFIIEKSNDGFGGFSAMWIYYSKCHVGNCIIRDNNTGIKSVFDCILSLDNCQIYNNSNMLGNIGGGLYCLSTYADIHSCFFHNNSTVNGGAIHLSQSEVNITNSVFANNIGESGVGAIHSNQSVTDINFCTFYNNRSLPGSFQTIFSNTNSCYLNNSILWNDNGEHMSSSYIDVSFCDVSDGNYSTNGNFNDYPHFVDITNNDFHLKSTTRHYSFANGWDIDPSDCSPCINAGNPSYITYSEPDGGPIVNIGAYGNTNYASYACSSKIGSYNQNKSGNYMENELILIYPNPANRKLIVELDLKTDCYVNMYISDMSGKQIASLVQNTYKSGYNLFSFNIEEYGQLKNGIYLFTIETNENVISEKIIINR